MRNKNVIKEKAGELGPDYLDKFNGKLIVQFNLAYTKWLKKRGFPADIWRTQDIFTKCNQKK